MSANDRLWRELAERVAADVFVNGQGETADRLVLVKDAPLRELGGWGRMPFIDRVERVLRAADEAAPVRLRYRALFCADCGKRVPCQAEYPTPPDHCPQCGALQTERRTSPAIGPHLHCHSCRRDTPSDRYRQP
jgi:hypothetical protein